MTTGLIMLAAGGLGYLLAALDPLGVLLVLAERGGSPALFAVGVVIAIGASFVVLGALVYALRDVRLDPVRPDANRSVRRPPSAGAQDGSAGSTGADAGPGPAPSDSR